MLFGNAMAEIQGGNGTPSNMHGELIYLGGAENIQCQIPSQCLHGIFHHDHLTNNFKRLDQYYQKKLTSSEDIDDRVFLNRSVKNITPFKASPYSRTSQQYIPKQTGNFLAAK